MSNKKTLQDLKDLFPPFEGGRSRRPVTKKPYNFKRAKIHRKMESKSQKINRGQR
jgi:hypothetical protein